MLLVLAGIGVLAIVAVIALFVSSHFGVFGIELERRPARQCEICGSWFVVPNEWETVCYSCIAGKMQEEIDEGDGDVAVEI